MKTYVDANAFIRLYLDLPGSLETEKALKEPGTAKFGPILITQLLQFEITNGLERMVFESRQGGQWRVTTETAACALADFNEDLVAGIFILPSPLTLAEIDPEFTSLVARYTAKHGFRTYDMLHVASALKLRCKRFFSFDAKANALAKLVGLKTR